MPGDAKRGFATPCEGDCGRQPGRSPRLASEGRAAWVSHAALRPGAAWAGSVESLVNGRSILRISPRLSYLTRRVPRTTQTGSAYHRPARSRHQAAPSARSVPLSTNHARSAGESQTPICAGGRTPSPGPPVRLRSATGPPSLPAGDSSAGAKTGLGPQVVGFVRLSSSRAQRPNPRRPRIGARAVPPPPASRPGSCGNLRSASQPGPPDRRIPVRSRKRNAIGAIGAAQNGTGPIK